MIPPGDPGNYEKSFSSFGMPDFMTGKIAATGRGMQKSIASPAKNVNFELEN